MADLLPAICNYQIPIISDQFTEDQPDDGAEVGPRPHGLTAILAIPLRYGNRPPHTRINLSAGGVSSYDILVPPHRDQPFGAALSNSEGAFIPRAHGMTSVVGQRARLKKLYPPRARDDRINSSSCIGSDTLSPARTG